MPADPARRLVAEALGTGLLVATVVGSGIMGDALVALVKHLEHPDQPLAAAEQEAIGRLVTMVEMIKPIVAEGTRKEELRKIPVKTVELLQLAKAGKTG